MGSTDAPAPAAVSPRPRRVRRLWVRLVLAGGVLSASGLLAREGWAYWQERSARQAMAEEHFDEAQRHIDQALRVRQRRSPTHLLAARIARLRGDYSQAEQHLSRCGELVGMNDALHLEWLLLRCQRGQVDELAPGLLATVDAHHPESAAILEALAGVYMRQTRYLEALRCLDRWVELAPDCVRALDWRGWVSNQLDHRGQAISDYERTLELQPGRSVVRLRLAEILVESARQPEALPHLERLRDEQPTNPDVLVALARCWMVQARTDDARALLESVLASRPDHFEALHQRGRLELQESNFTEAERWLRKALARAPRDAEARYSLYLSLQAQADRQREAQQELARWQQDRRTRDRLTRLLRAELDRRPNDPDLAEETGELFLQLGEDRQALFWLHRALSLDPRHAPSHRALIAYYERTESPARAAEHRQKLAALKGPESEVVPESEKK
jgi:tetratricopeptide (TPR) repeat protein